MSRVFVDSGIKWIGTLPNTWKITTVNKIFFRRKEINNEKNPIILSLSRDGVKIRDITTNEGQLAESYDNYHKVYKDDLMINPMDLISGANCSLSEVEGVISPAYINLAKKEKIYPKYYDYFFKYQYWINAMFIHGKGVSFDNRWTINWETMANYKLPLPSYDEQIKISNYLDDKVSLIDETIENNKKEIKLLEEYKKNYSTELFTKLLGKYSSIKIKKMCSKISKGETPKDMITEFNDEYCYRFLKCENLVNREVLPVPLFTISFTTYNNMKRSQLEVNDILFVIAGATIGKTAILTEDMLPSNTNQAISFIRLNDKCDINVKYVEHFLNTRFVDDVILLNSVQSAQPNISMEDLGNIKIPIVGIEEKEMIVNNIDNITKKLNRVIDYRKNIIEKLEEYKKSLIYEAVTGKIEV